MEIKVIVNDLNDEKPVFIPSTMVGELKENSVVGKLHVKHQTSCFCIILINFLLIFKGSSFMTIRAEDKDTNVNFNGVVRYKYVDGSESPAASEPRFSVNNAGQVTLRQTVDREDVQQITFLALAMDGYEGGLILLIFFLTVHVRL